MIVDPFRRLRRCDLFFNLLTLSLLNKPVRNHTGASAERVPIWARVRIVSSLEMRLPPIAQPHLKTKCEHFCRLPVPFGTDLIQSADPKCNPPTLTAFHDRNSSTLLLIRSNPPRKP